MKNKEYYFDLLEHRIIDFNSYWEKPLGETKLRSDTKDSVELLKAYFKTLMTIEKQRKKHDKPLDDYDKYPDNVKEIIKSIIDIISDGRDLWTPTKFNDRTYDHHIETNGHLGFENDPWSEVRWCYDFLEEIEKIMNSEKKTGDFAQFIDDKWYYFDGVEEGSASVRFNKINITEKGKYTFDGDIIWWATIDSQFNGDGVIIQKDLEDISFNELPYMDDDFEDPKEFIECLNNCKKETTEEIKKSVHRCFDEYYLDEL